MCNRTINVTNLVGKIADGCYTLVGTIVESGIAVNVKVYNKDAIEDPEQPSRYQTVQAPHQHVILYVTAENYQQVYNWPRTPADPHRLEYCEFGLDGALDVFPVLHYGHGNGNGCELIHFHAC